MAEPIFSGPSQKIELKVYVEGHEIPCHGFSLTLFDGQPAQGNIATTPSDSIKRIPPMCTVAVFYYDNNYRDWCLLFEGIYTGWQFSRDVASRVAILYVMGSDILLSKITANMFTEDDALTAAYRMYGVGDAAPVKFGKGANLDPIYGNKGKATIDAMEKIANLSFRMFMPRGLLSFELMAKQALLAASKDQKSVDMAGLIEQLTQGMMWVNPLVFHRYITSRMSYKSISAPDDMVKNFLSYDYILNILTSMGGAYFREETTTQDVISMWMQQCFYSKSTCCAPSYSDVNGAKRIHQTIYHPQSFFSIPPACNILFPDFISNISYTESFLEHPTRMISRIDPLLGLGGDTNVEMGYFYSELGEYVNSRDILNKMKALPRNLYISEYSDEEYAKYPKPSSIKINNSLAYQLIKQGKSLSDIKDTVEDKNKKIDAIVGQTTQYMFLEQKYGTRPLTISGSFNPYFSVGFPCIVFDESSSFMAKPLSITHNINASGDASTQYSCNFALPLDSDDLISDGKNVKFPPIPAWVPDAYRPKQIDDTYSKIFGNNAFGYASLGGYANKSGNPTNAEEEIASIAEGKGTLPYRINMSRLANTVFSLNRASKVGSYDKSDDKLGYARQYIMRKVTTFAQYMDFYGAKESAPKSTMPSSMNLFKHIVKIITAKSGDKVLWPAPEDPVWLSSTVEELLAAQTTDDETNMVAEVLATTVKYDKMALIQKDLNRTSFVG